MMMQLILLNESHEYYVAKSQSTATTTVNESFGFGKTTGEKEKFHSHITNSLKHYDPQRNSFKLKEYED